MFRDRKALYLPFPRSRVSHFRLACFARDLYTIKSLAQAMNWVYWGYSLFINYSYFCLVGHCCLLVQSSQIRRAWCIDTTCSLSSYSWHKMGWVYILINDGFRFSSPKRLLCVIRRTRERKNSPFSHRPQCTLFTPPSLNPTPPKKCITIVFDSYWDDCNCNT